MLSKADKDYIAAAIVAGIEVALTQVAAPAASAPVRTAKANTFVDEVIRGRHTCSAKPSCGRELRTAKRAAIHGKDGHSPAK